VAEVKLIEAKPQQIKVEEKKETVIIQSNISHSGSKMIE